MSAATAAREDKRSEGRLKAFDVAAVAVYKGTLVGLNSSGYLTSMLHSTASLRFRGVCVDTKDNSAGSAGDLEARVWQDGEYEFVYNGGDAAQALVGEKAYAVDNQTVDEDPTTVTNEYPIGTIVEVISATKVRVRIEPSFAANDAAQAAIVSLTDSTGLSGTHDDTLAATAAPTTLTDSTGLSGTHDDTLAASTVPTTLTDSTGLSGSHNDTLAAVTTFTPSVAWDGAAVFPSAADATAIATAITTLNQNASDTAQKVIEHNTLLGVMVQNDSDIAQKVIEHNTLLGVIAQNQSDTAQKVLEILTALRGAGIIAQ